MASTVASVGSFSGMSSFSGIQKLGRALMLPIAVLPVAGLLLRLGQGDVLDIPAIAAAGGAIFSNLGLLFAVGVAVGLARENHGAAGLAALVAYFVTTEGAKVLIPVPPETVAEFTGRAADLAANAYKQTQLARLSVPAGIISGLIAGWLYNRYSNIQLPSYLAFFGGRRFVPIAAGLAGLIAAAVFGYGFPLLSSGIDVLSKSVVASGEIGLFVYGVLNRALLVTGLHHVLNNVAWFVLGDYQGATGDLNRFFKGDPSAGGFMSGFFPVMMFGLPAACLAMYHAAAPERRAAVGGLLVSLALTSFLTGVTEPIEFTFIFLAPALYALHALLTGAALVVMDVLNVRLGFSFSAGLFDYVINYGKSTNPLLLLPVGAAYAGVYYGVFRVAIKALNLQTPGREPLDEEAGESAASVPLSADLGGRAAAFVAALGGGANLTSVDACATRLRLVVASQDGIDDAALKRLGARATVRLSARDVQVILGPIADQVAGEIRAQLRVPRPAGAPAAAAAAAVKLAPTSAAVPAAAAAPTAGLASNLVAALGGKSNVRDIEVSAGTRLRIDVADGAAVQESGLLALGLRGVQRPSADRVQLLVGPGAEQLAVELRELIKR